MNKTVKTVGILAAIGAVIYFVTKGGFGGGDAVSKVEAQGITLTDKQKQLLRDVESGKIPLSSLSPAQQEFYRVYVLGGTPASESSGSTSGGSSKGGFFDKASKWLDFGKKASEVGKQASDTFGKGGN